MNEPLATKGTFSDFKLIKTRKVCQLVIEIPIEQADAALAALGGLPRSDSERWVAIARLHDSVPYIAPKGRAFSELPYPQQAAIKSNDLTFKLWISANYMTLHASDCADAIRKICSVSSRADILPGTRAGETWIKLLREYERDTL